MNLREAFRVSYKALDKNKVRSFLTTLGIIIGVASVIAIISVTQGAKKLIQEQIISLGGNYLIVSSGKKAGSGASVHTGTVVPLTSEDAEAIGELGAVTNVSPILRTTDQVVWYNRSWFTTIVGASADFPVINDWFPEKGTFFIHEDVINADRVCVLGKTVASKLFGYQSPLGETVRITNVSFKVIGVLSFKGRTPGGGDQDDIVVMPYTTLQKRILGVTYVNNIAVSVKSSSDLPFVQAQITQLLRARHHIRPGMEDDFNVSTQLDILKRIFTVSKILTILLGCVASISLIVGGIGIMNIMHASVTERIREIGIRMSVGASELDILIQFLIEAVLISLVGGIIGVVLGVAGLKVASFITHWPSPISLITIIIPFTFAGIIGITFGLYPARKASKLDPIEALRHE
jgi:putative ABC transport system permease protein